MAFNARVLSVFIASPGDTMAGRDQVEETITAWNRVSARSRGVVLLPLRWEHNAVPELDGDGQAMINKQLVRHADVVIALFHTRLGSPTDRAESGTAEEIEEAQKQGTPVHVYFSREPIPHDADTDELDRVRRYESSLRAEGLLGEFSSLEDLDRKVFAALQSDVEKAGASAASGQGGSKGPEASFRVWLDKSGGSDRLVLENIGGGPAQNLRIVKNEPVGDGNGLNLVGQDDVEILQPNNEVRFLAAVAFGTAAQHTITLAWDEGDQEFGESHSLTIF